MSDLQRQQPLHRILMFLLIGLLALLRMVHLDSDAYARLSWSSALLTDEGFYVHTSRNLILFGQSHTDDFNNALIMPLLHGVQVIVFSLCGVGTLQARSISVVSSLLSLLLFFCALRRAFSPRVAWLGLLLLGLDPVFTLYNRLALMDTPACLPLCAAFYAWTYAGEEKEKRRRGEEERLGQEPWSGAKAENYASARGKMSQGRSRTSTYFHFSFPPFLPFFLCGLCLGLAYAVRGLAAVVVPVPFLLLIQPLFVNRRHNNTEHRHWMPLLTLAGGLGLALLPYMLLWYIPHHQEIARVNAYYLNHQLKPDSLRHLLQNIQHAFFGDDRGLSPYLFRHSPVTFALALLWLTTRNQERKEEKEKRRKGEEERQETGNGKQGIEGVKPSFNSQPSTYLALWLLLTWLLLAVISYAPDRYYVLFYPAMCGLAALALYDLPRLLLMLWQSWRERMLLGGFLAYHLGEAFLHHQSRNTDICLAAFTTGTLVTLAILPLNMSQWRERGRAPSNAAITLALLLWAVVAVGWFGDWLRHLEYTQRDADHWLATHLPENSVLIGDVAPGLCLNNRFRCVNVIPGLCNDKQPIERFAPAPRYIIILDGKFKERWWRDNYPELVTTDHLVHTFPRIIRLPVGVYQVSGFRYPGSDTNKH